MSSHPSIVKTKDGRTNILNSQDELDLLVSTRPASLSESLRKRSATFQEAAYQRQVSTLFKHLNRQNCNIYSTIEQFEEMQIDNVTFHDLEQMLENRRDFMMLRNMKLVKRGGGSLQ